MNAGQLFERSRCQSVYIDMKKQTRPFQGGMSKPNIETETDITSIVQAQAERDQGRLRMHGIQRSAILDILPLQQIVTAA